MELSYHVLKETWLLTAAMAPYLLLGFLVAGLLSIFVQETWIERWLGGRGFGASLRAVLVGIPMPLCSCGVIPVAASLYHRKAGKGATTAFLTATPQTGVDSIAATYALMGWFFSVVRVFVALISGLITGILVDAVEPEVSKRTVTGIPVSSDKLKTASNEPFIKKLRQVFNYGFYALPLDIGKALVAGIIFAGLISALVPDAWIQQFLGQGWMIYLVMTGIAIPLYVCSTGSIPVAYAFMSMGVSPGAALIFLIAGPATNAATISTFWKIMGKRTILVYLGTLIAVAWVFALILDSMTLSETVIQHVHMHEVETGWFAHLSGFILVALLIFPRFSFPHKKGLVKNENIAGKGSIMNEVTIEIRGMNCTHCSSSVKKTIERIPGAENIQVDHKSGMANFTLEKPDKNAIQAEIEALGFEVISITV